jgi:hypothetical protein
MKTFYSIFCLVFLFIACQPKVDNAANEAFEKNSLTALANIEGFENEAMDYSMYADNFVLYETNFGANDSLNLDDIKSRDAELWEMYDFEMLTDPVVLLPGVNAETKVPDGSVRYYGDWKVTLPATDSTEARSGVMRMYESFDFDADGKILYQQAYADFTGLFMYLHSEE